MSPRPLARRCDTLARHITTQAERTARSVEPVARFVALLIFAILGALALVHYATPCDAGHLCMGAALVPTRTTPWGRLYRRLRARLRAAWLRVLITGAERDLAWQEEQTAMAEWELQAIPRQSASTRLHIEALRVQLISAELDARGA